MDRIVRDNPVMKDGAVFTAMECKLCGEMYIPSRIHICKKRNSFPTEGKISKPTRRILDSDVLLNAIEEYCDQEDKIDFKTIYTIIKTIKQHKAKKGR